MEEGLSRTRTIRGQGKVRARHSERSTQLCMPGSAGDQVYFSFDRDEYEDLPTRLSDKTIRASPEAAPAM